MQIADDINVTYNLAYLKDSRSLHLECFFKDDLLLYYYYRMLFIMIEMIQVLGTRYIGKISRLLKIYKSEKLNDY